MIWEQAYLFAEDEQEWTWAEKEILGIPCLVRILITLKRSGLSQVFVTAPLRKEASAAKIVEAYRGKKDLPRIIWSSRVADSADAPCGPLLGVRASCVFEPGLLHWFSQVLKASSLGSAHLKQEDGRPVLISSFRAGIPEEEGEAAERHDIPPELFCRPVWEMMEPEQFGALLATVGKPTDRRHVVEVRKRSFPLIRWLAAHRVTPNQVTWGGFLVALAACLVLAQGNYWSGIAGAVLLYFSWAIDCMDGTLARLTFSESAFGRKLDTFLGHVTNLCIFSALIWSVYGHESIPKAIIFGFFILGGIMMAYKVTEEKNRFTRRENEAPQHCDLQRFLDKVNHRDYAVIVFVLALLNGFRLFLWLSVVGIQVYWLLYLWTIRRQRADLSTS